MKNSFVLILCCLLLGAAVNAESINIKSKNISLDKNTQISIFENDVLITTEENIKIKSDYASYDRVRKFILLKGNISVIDNKNNIIETNQATYNENSQVFESVGKTLVITSNGYRLTGENIIFDNSKKIISSNKDSLLEDNKNNIYLENFEYLINQNIFKSVGYVKIEDLKKNIYEFSQIYIDTKQKKILGTDIKAKINQEDFKINEKNKPRIFANAVQISEKKSLFEKSIFTICDYRAEDKCPPWSIQSSKMLHDNEKKTIFYENAVVKVYDIPIFYSPKLSHPDPTVDRRSGFLAPSFQDTKNLGAAVSIPYFFNLAKDKNFTLTNQVYVDENPLFMGEYHQAFMKSNLILDFGYTEGYKKTSATKKPGEKSHLFSKFVSNFTTQNNFKNSIILTTQDTSNDKYLKLYKIKSNLVDYNKDILENSLDFTTEKEDFFFGFNTSIYETLKDNYDDKYEYIFPNITIDKNIFNNSNGTLGLQTNFKAHNYDTNKLKSFFINNFDYSSNFHSLGSIASGEILANIKNINYETKNVENFKDDFTSEIYGALGYLAKIDLIKENNEAKHLLTPKLFLRYAPGNMRKEENGSRLSPSKAFNLQRIDEADNFEVGLSGALGFDYNVNKNGRKLDFSVAQIINEKENKKRHSQSSLDEKLSDLVGSVGYNLNNKMNLNYKFALDENYSDLNYNEVGAFINFDKFSINFDYLKEAKHIGSQEYYKTKVDFLKNENGTASFQTKQNLITNSTEYYDLSYQYINDCLKAGLVYRREFYQDSELEPENSLMFKITLTPFGELDSPKLNN